MIHLENNQCPICLKNNLVWNLNISKSDMQMFKCGHGLCKGCYQKKNIDNFSCPSCGESAQLHLAEIMKSGVIECATFAEWYGDFGVYIESGAAKNILKHTNFGRQLLRLIKEVKIDKKKIKSK